uniref:Uncharacterized protein n=1 Tax=Anguilla anguilla TaxID=7936 RepID=A0A0E9UR55_ANGAN
MHVLRATAPAGFLGLPLIRSQCRPWEQGVSRVESLTKQ